jgi:hypothetical protein
MSDISQGEGWWRASDGKWYAPQFVPSPPDQSDPTMQADPTPALDDQKPAIALAIFRRPKVFALSAGIVVVLVVVAGVFSATGGHSADWNRGYTFGTDSDIFPGAAPSMSGGGHNIQVAFSPSDQICTNRELSYASDLDGAGGVSIGVERLAAAETHPTQDFFTGCVAGVEHNNSQFLIKHGLSTSCGDWGNAKGLLPGC